MSESNERSGPELTPSRETPNPPPQETRGPGLEKGNTWDIFSSPFPNIALTPKSTIVALPTGKTSWPIFIFSFAHSFTQPSMDTPVLGALDSGGEASHRNNTQSGGSRAVERDGGKCGLKGRCPANSEAAEEIGLWVWLLDVRQVLGPQKHQGAHIPRAGHRTRLEGRAGHTGVQDLYRHWHTAECSGERLQRSTKVCSQETPLPGVE